MRANDNELENEERQLKDQHLMSPNMGLNSVGNVQQKRDGSDIIYSIHCILNNNQYLTVISVGISDCGVAIPILGGQCVSNDLCSF